MNNAPGVSVRHPRILIVDDHVALRAALGALLERAGYDVLALPDGTELVEHLDAFLPDLALLEVGQGPGPDGLALARLIRSRSTLPIVFVASAASLADRLAGFDAGADDYLVKPYAGEELLARIQALLRRSGRAVSQVWQVGDLVVDDSARSASRAGHLLDLTRTEYDLLTVLAQHVGSVQSKSGLLSQVWGFTAHDTNLVEVHVSSLRRKLEVAGPRIIQTVRGDGYLLLAAS